MPYFIAHHSTSPTTLQQRYGPVHIIDVTSRGAEPWMRFSPFYPHGGIPVPFSSGYTSASVEGIWQGLKVFERMDVDTTKFKIISMKGIKRSSKKYGVVLGHRAGVGGEHLLTYAEARRAIYLPSYHWILTHKLHDVLEQLAQLAATQTVVFLDYETNCDLDDLRSPLSHAGLVKRYLEGDWPE